MYAKQTALLAATIVLALPAAAVADSPHVVAAGETLTSVAAADGLSVSALASANGLSSRAELRVGQVIEIPPQDSTTDAMSTVGGATAGSPSATSAADSVGRLYMVQPGDTLSAIAARIGTTPAHLAAVNGLSVNGTLLAGAKLMLPASSGASPSDVSTDSESATSESATGESDSTSAAGGSYQVQVGDTLSAIAAASGTTVAQLAALNGLNPNHVLLAGSTLTLPAGSTASTGAGASTGAATGAGNQQISGDTSAGPYPTDEDVSSSQVGAQAASAGVSPSLAEAIGWQESGYDNDVVSPTGAVGVMQIEPATWAWINQVLTPGAPLDPSSAYDNVEGGVLLLHNLVSQTGSDSLAAAAYYQGLASVEAHGEYAETQQYVADVAALQARF